MLASNRTEALWTPGDLFEGRHLLLYCQILLALEIFASLFLAAGTYGLIVPVTKPLTTDFVSFYAAGTLTDAGTPQLAYDQVHHHAAEEQAREAGIDYNYFYYPPIFLLVCALLAHLPYIVAFFAFEIATLVLYLLVARCILNESGWLTLLRVVVFPVVFWNFAFGQNAFLTAALFGAGTLCIDRRPLVAGILFGALCYKPQFALLIPVALAAGGHWRALAGACSSAIALSLLSLVALGWETWRDFITAASAASSAVYAFGRIPFTGYINLFGAVRQLGGGQTIAYAAQAAASLSALALVVLVWHRKLRLPVRAATLCSAALVAAPLALFYDLMLGAVAALWLLRREERNRLSDGEKIALSGLFLLSLSPRSLAESSHLPVGPFIALALFGLVAIYSLRQMTMSCTSSRAARASRTVLNRHVAKRGEV
jgi:Glycosyltransferase family 87